MTRITFDAETGTDGTTCTTGNTGFDQVNVVGGTSTFATAAAIHGALGYRIVTTSGSANQYIENFPAAAGEVAIRFYFKVPSGTVTANSQQATVRNSGANMAIIVIDTSKRLVCQDTAGGDTMTPGSALPAAGTVIRCELRVVKGTTSTDGVRHFAYYLGDSTTPEYEATDSTSNTGTTNATNARFGRTTGSTWVTTIDLDDFVLDDAPAGALIGPVAANVAVSAPPAFISLVAPIPVVTAETYLPGDSSAMVSVRAAAPTVAAGVAVSAPPAVSAVVARAPSVSAGATAAAPPAFISLVAAPPSVSTSANASVAAPPAFLTVLSRPSAVSAGATVAAPRSAISLTTVAPAVSAGATVGGTAARVALYATAPVVSAAAVVQGSKALVSLAAHAPTITAGANVAAPVASVVVMARPPDVVGLGTAPDVPANRTLRITVPVRTLRILEAP